MWHLGIPQTSPTVVACTHCAIPHPALLSVHPGIACQEAACAQVSPQALVQENPVRGHSALAPRPGCFGTRSPLLRKPTYLTAFFKEEKAHRSPKHCPFHQGQRASLFLPPTGAWRQVRTLPDLRTTGPRTTACPSSLGCQGAQTTPSMPARSPAWPKFSGVDLEVHRTHNGICQATCSPGRVTW